MSISMHEDIKALYLTKIELYEELADLLEQERKSLESADLEAMWKFSDQKQRISTRLVQIRNDILAALTRAGIRHHMNESTFHTPTVISLMPKEPGRVLQKIHISLVMIKNKVHSLSQENKKFVTDYLGILDELIGIITNAGNPQPVYDNARHCRTGKKSNLLLHKEV